MSESYDNNETPKLPPQLPKPPRTWLTLLMGAILLLAGGVIGAGMTIVVVKQRIDEAQTQAMDAPGEMGRRIADRMTHELDLTPEQAEQFRTLFEEHHRNMKTLFGTLQEDIQAILTAEQLARWQEISRKFRRDRRDGGGHRDRDKRGGERRDGPPRERREHDGDYRDRDRPPPPAEERIRDERGLPREPDAGELPHTPPPPPEGGFTPPESEEFPSHPPQ